MITEKLKKQKLIIISSILIGLLLPIGFLCSSLNAKILSAIDRIRLPKDFVIHLYAENIENARSMALGDKGTLFVGSRNAGKVYAIVDTNHDYKADRVYTIASGLNMPNGVAFKNGSLYVAELNFISRFDNIEDNLAKPPKPIFINDSFPSNTHHGWKYIAIGPDNKLYVPVGAPCNVCNKDDERYASIMRMDLDGTHLEVYAHGVRNTVGFDWSPETNELWFTDNGRDMMGDDLPPDELNVARTSNLHFGFPFCHGNTIIDPDYGEKDSCGKYQSPAVELGAHVASLGMTFYRGKHFPVAYQNKIYIAEHGSWNRSTKVGYRITTVDYSGSTAKNYQIFAEGWLSDDRVFGRPVDILELPDGSLLVSDDYANRIYRIAYAGEDMNR